jgi:hypothetical protein
VIGNITFIGSSCETVVRIADGRHEVADLDGRDSGDAVDRGVDLRPVQVEPRVRDRGLGGLHLRFAGAHRLDGVVELLLADRTLRGERRVAPDVCWFFRRFARCVATSPRA